MRLHHGPPRPRPVAETPVAALVADAPELAKRWLIALIASRPLPGAERVPIDDLVRQAPALCAQMVRALASELECDRLAPGGDLALLVARAGLMAGADEPAGAVAAVEALRGVLWSALMAELRDPTPTLVSELAGRLAHVCALVTGASVVALSRASVRPAGQAPHAAPPAGEAPAQPSAPPPDRGPPTAVPVRVSAGGRPAPAGAPPAPADADAAGVPATSDAPPPHSAPPDHAQSAAGAAPTMSGEGPASWVGSIGRRLDRFREDGLPFAVLLIELADLDRLRDAAPPEELAGLVAQVERAVSGVLRPADLLSRESLGRYWLVTPETDVEGARALAERVAFAVQSDASHRGASLRVAIGTAVCPDDGLDAASLAARADIAMYGARASGQPVVTIDEPL